MKKYKYWVIISGTAILLAVMYGRKLQVELSGSQFMPHGECLFWEPLVVYTMVGSNLVIWLSYCAIGLELLWIFKRGGKLFNRELAAWFASFILLCGWGHFTNAMNFYYARYIVESMVLVSTAIASTITVLRLRAARGVIAAQIKNDKLSIESAIEFLETSQHKGGSSRKEYEREKQAITERLRQISLLQIMKDEP